MTAGVGKAELVPFPDYVRDYSLPTDGRVVERSAVFVRPGLQPHPDGLLAGLGCEIADHGFIGWRLVRCGVGRRR